MKKTFLRFAALATCALLILGGCSKGSKYSSSEKSEEKKETSSKSKKEAHKLDVDVLPAPHLKAQGGNHYESKNLIDGKPHTAWVIDITKEIDNWMLGELPDILQFTLDADQVDYIMLTNGYAKNEAHFRKNARPREIVISRTPFAKTKPSDVLYRGAIKDTMEPQKLKVDKKYDNSRPTNKIYISFTGDWVKGEKWPNDFSVSEIEFYGH